MKKRRQLAIIVISMFLLSACNGTSSNKALRGTWMNDEETLTFVDDDTYVSNYYYGFGNESTYMVDGDKITFSIPLIGNDTYYFNIDAQTLYLYTDSNMTELDAKLKKK